MKRTRKRQERALRVQHDASCPASFRETNAVENKIRFKTATTKGNQENGEKDGTN